MNKFKPGDRVVWLSADHPNNTAVGTVIKQDRIYVYFLNTSEYDTPKEEYDHCRYFVLEEVYNTPLFKAMTEEENES